MPDSATAVRSLRDRFFKVRRLTHELCEPLEVEDYVIQTMTDVSPTKWHLAHTSWFFETFVLMPRDRNYRSPNPRYAFLFNSYYNTVGQQHRRDNRGFISRPTVREVFEYRSHVDEHMAVLLDRADGTALDEIAPIVDIGLNHEQQHQELMLTDIKHVFSNNPLRPAYRASTTSNKRDAAIALEFAGRPGGVHWIGHDGSGFSYDNELPRHRVFIEPFRMATRLVTNGEYLAFIEDGGYRRPELWLSDGWAAVNEEKWMAPLYWEKNNGRWEIFTLSGMRELDEAEPVCHVSFYEADAYARWAGCRLPSEAEWETVAVGQGIQGNFVGDGVYHPRPASQPSESFAQLYGDVWEWTGSPYTPYPGYKAVEGALGEYNGKFMCNQFVLRGGSCATSRDHVRRTYRNFFPPNSRWQFSGIRLAKDGEE